MHELDLEFHEDKRKNGPVTCLGQVFATEDDRRAYFRERLREHLPALRKLPGFPITAKTARFSHGDR
ncbi:MAG: hypothetical protein M1318_07075 [Firmicutes bacterium]|nr:hypothetical protein [Bacillota bacterium]